MVRLARRRMDGSALAVELDAHRAEALPFESGVFDCAVSTWSLCSVDDAARALAEIHRVLRPGGQLLFVEHGLSPEPKVQRWQHRLNPIQCKLGAGCNLNRDYKALAEAQGFRFTRLERFNMPGEPRFLGHTYAGVAVKDLGASRS
jgi:ubiquinone/menaquinone biosynthesis C-methylase UbiE